MVQRRIHVIHVGNMNNKGTQALIGSDIHVIKEIVPSPSISVSTTDVDGVKRLNLDITNVLPPIIDIPYELADQIARKFGYGRNGYQYKLLALAALFYMPIQIFFSICSIGLVKLGATTPYRSHVFECMKACDLVISHSDESFKETASLLPLNPFWVLTWWSMLIARTWEILAARSFKKQVIVFPNSIGPFRTLIGRSLAKLSLNNCHAILIRDSTSYEIAQGLSLSSRAFLMLTYDTALLFKSNSKSHKWTFKASAKPIIGVSPGVYSHSITREEVLNYVASHAEALDKVIKKFGFHIVFIPHYISGFQNDDLEICNSIISRMKQGRAVELIKVTTASDFKSLLDQMDLVVSSKMHPAVLAVSGYVPTLCIAYDHKQISFFERLDMEDCLLDIRDISCKNLFEKIEHIWKNKDRLKAVLEERIPIWQRNIKESIRKALVSLIS